MMKMRLSSNLRIISAFAIKDIRDAIQNKMILRVGIGTLMVWLSSMALPLLLSLRTTLDVRVFDPGRSEMVRELAKAEELDVQRVRFEAELLDGVGGSFNKTLGLFVDPGVDEALDRGEQVVIQGYYPHWMEPGEVSAMAAEVMSVVEERSGQALQIRLDEGRSYPSYTTAGHPTMTSSALVIVIFTIGGMLTPFLMIEEKEKGTLAALMVSPASQWQFVLGKALAGLFYSLIVAGVALAMSGRWIVHWELAILGVLAGAIFTVSLGLLVGVFTQNPSSMGLWFGLLMMAMLVPVFVEFFPAKGELSWWQAMIKWLPSVGFSDVVRASFVGTYPEEIYLRGFGSMLATATGMLALVSWRLRKIEM